MASQLEHNDEKVFIVNKCLNSLERWWIVLFIWMMSFCNDLKSSLLVFVSV